jgi:3-hydroxyisobutyrate dehydrogenase-like beta-hydroxyacid dehydrogenase
MNHKVVREIVFRTLSSNVKNEKLAAGQGLERIMMEDIMNDERRIGHDGIHVSMSTISPKTAARLADQQTSFGGQYVAASFWGGRMWPRSKNSLTYSPVTPPPKPR